MAIACVCPVCERKFRVDDAVAGKTIACPECAEPIFVDPADRVAPKERSTKPTKLPEGAKSKKNAASIAAPYPAIPPVVLIGGGLGLVLLVGLALAGGYWLRSVADNPKKVVPESTAPPGEVSQTETASPTQTSPAVAQNAADLSAFVAEETPAAPDPEVAPPAVAVSPSVAESVASVPMPPPTVAPEVKPAETVPTDSANPVEAPLETVSTVRSAAPLPIASSESAQAQVASVQSILKDACYRCHGESGTNEGGMNYVLNLSKVRESLIRPGDSKNSPLMRRIASSDPETVMPPRGESPALTPEQVALVQKWIDDGAAIPAPREERKFITDDIIVRTVHADLMAAPDRSRRFIRYFTLTSLYNSGVSEDELETYRLAFAKLINSLSWGRQVILPHRVDSQGTILRVDVRDLNWGNEIWEQIVGVNPYPYQPAHELAEKVYEQCATPEPWVRVDWFVFKASRPPLYHQILRIPETEAALEDVLHVNAQTNIEQEKVVRAGFNRSGVSRNNRLIERHEISSGAYWKSYDFAANTGRQNLFEYPAGPEGADAFSHDGGELIFTLPNGLLGFMLTDSKGARLDSGPTSIVSDPATHDRTVINGLSCFSCHYAGFIQKDDEIRPFLDLNAKAFENSDYLKSIYPGQAALNDHYKSDGAAYLKSLATIGITNTSRAGEPISSMSQRFQSELSVRQAAAEFGMTESEFYRCLDRRPTLPRSLGVLRVSGGTLKRDAFTELYKEAMEQIRTTPEPSEDELVEITTVSRKLVDQIALTNLRPSSLALTADGSRLLVVSDTSGLMLFDTRTGETLGSAVNNRDGWGTIARFSPRGDRFVISGRDGVIQVWSIAESGLMKEVSQFSGHSVGGRGTEIQQLCISGDGSTAVSVCGNRLVQTWSLATGKPVRALPEPLKVGVIASWISSDGRDVLLADNTGLAAFSTRNNRDLNLTKMALSASHSGTIAPNGKLLAITGFDGLSLINTANGQAMATFKSPSGMFRGAAFANQGRCVLGFTHNQVVGWRVSDQKPIEVLITSGFGPFSLFSSASQGALCAWTESSGAQNLVRLTPISASPRAAAVGTVRSAARPTRAGKFRAGDKAEILYGNRWTPVTVINVISDVKVRIHWDGWSDNWDEDIDVSRIRRPESPSSSK